MEAPGPTPRIPDYELVRLIGRGSYGDVWLARGITGAWRAVKVVWRDRYPELRPYEREFEGITRFAAVSLREPSQLALLHAGRDDVGRFFYYVMELADDVETGRDIDPVRYAPYTLHELFDRRGRLPAAEVISLGVTLGRAVANLHAAGLIHRDIKPSNIIVVGGVPKLADIGLVALASAGAVTFVGTEGFVPPEGPGAPAADVYSLGKVLYELATGLDRNDFPQLPDEISNWADRAEFLELNEVLLRACESDVRLRYRDAGALLDDLLLLQAGRSVRRLRNAERRLARALRVAAVLGLIAAVAGTGAWLERRRADEEMALRARAEAERDALARRAVYAATLAQAQRALEQEDYGRARQFLAGAAPATGEGDLRAFEWHALSADAEGDPARILRREGPAGMGAFFSPDGRKLAVNTSDSRITVWDAIEGSAKSEFAKAQLLAGFSPDGRWLLGVDAKASLRRWRAMDGTLDDTAADGVNWSIGWLGIDRALAYQAGASGGPHRLRCWDFATGADVWSREVPRTGEPDRGDLIRATLSADGKFCALALIHGRAQSASWRIMVLGLPELNVLWEETTRDRPTALVFGPRDQQLFCAYGNTGEVHAIDFGAAAGASREWRTRLPFGQPETLAHDGKTWLAVGGRSSNVCLLDLVTGQLVGLRRGHEGDVRSAAFNPVMPGMLATAGNGGDVRIWNLAAPPPAPLSGFSAPAGGGRALCLSGDGRLLAATAPDNYVRIDHTNGSGGAVALDGCLAPVQFSTTADRLWVLTNNAGLEARSTTADGGRLARIDLPIQPIAATAASDGRMVAAIDANSRLIFVNTAESRSSDVIDARHGYPWWVAVSPKGELVATGGRDGFVRLWDAAKGALVREWKPATPAVNGVFSPDGAKLALVRMMGAVELHTIQEGTSPQVLVTSSSVLQAVAFHPREARLLAGGRDGILHVIDLAAWRELAQLRAVAPGRSPGTLARMAFDHPGALLAGYLENGEIRVWRGASQD